jgi:hypothetical protein
MQERREDVTNEFQCPACNWAFEEELLRLKFNAGGKPFDGAYFGSFFGTMGNIRMVIHMERPKCHYPGCKNGGGEMTREYEH